MSFKSMCHYEVGVSGEFAVDPGRAAAAGDVRVDAPVGGVAGGGAVPVVEEDGADSQRVGHDDRQRHGHLVRTARHLHALLHRPSNPVAPASPPAAAAAAAAAAAFASQRPTVSSSSSCNNNNNNNNIS